MVGQKTCVCGGFFNFELNTFVHEPGCGLSARLSVASIASIATARFQKIEDPLAHDPRTALDVAREWIDNQETPPEHVIVLIGRTTPENSSGTRFFQAGKYAHHAQMGLCYEGREMIRESGRK